MQIVDELDAMRWDYIEQVLIGGTANDGVSIIGITTKTPYGMSHSTTLKNRGFFTYDIPLVCDQCRDRFLKNIKHIASLPACWHLVLPPWKTRENLENTRKVMSIRSWMIEVLNVEPPSSANFKFNPQGVALLFDATLRETANFPADMDSWFILADPSIGREGGSLFAVIAVCFPKNTRKYVLLGATFLNDVGEDGSGLNHMSKLYKFACKVSKTYGLERATCVIAIERNWGNTAHSAPALLQIVSAEKSLLRYKFYTEQDNQLRPVQGWKTEKQTKINLSYALKLHIDNRRWVLHKKFVALDNQSEELVVKTMIDQLLNFEVTETPKKTGGHASGKSNGQQDDFVVCLLYAPLVISNWISAHP